MSELPAGTVTFLFTDIEGSTPLWERSPQAMRAAQGRHNAILQAAIQQHGGQVFQTVGDAFCAAFAVPGQALEAALAAQRALVQEPWDETGPLRVRMGIHTGLAEVGQGEYLSSHTLNRVSRIMSAGHGGQVLVSAAVAELAREHLPEDARLVYLGEHRLKGLSQPERLFQLVAPDLPDHFPPLLTQQEAEPSANRGAGNIELLSTKFAVPYQHDLASGQGHHLVIRQSLLGRLEGGLSSKLTLISAPAGFGKTTLVSSWISSLRSEAVGFQSGLSSHTINNQPPQITHQKYAWVSLDSGDNDPVRFWRYLLTACRVFGEGLGYPALALLNMPEPPFEALLTGFINQVAELTGRYVIVLDDYHLITAHQIHTTVAFFLEHLPPALHVILITRSDPPLPLARMRARNELNELRAEDLRFSFDEAQAFIGQSISSNLSHDTIARLVQRTEGWVAGLHLVTLALRRQPDQAAILQFLDTFTGNLRPIQEYLVHEVFSAQPAYLQEFLLRTSILSRLTGSLCDEVTGRNDSAILLDQLERANLFLIPLDGTGEWYRFHTLFSEAMQHFARQQLGEDQLCALHHKASRWYEAHELLPEAVESALSAQDYQRAASLIERIITPRLAMNEHYTLKRWMEQIPEEVLHAYPTICMTFAVAILFTSDRHSPETRARLEKPLLIAEQHWQREENEGKLGELLGFRSLVAWLQRETVESFSLARQALQLLPDGEVQWRGVSLVMVGAEELYAGNLNRARQIFKDALACLEAAENIFGILDSSLWLGEIYFQQGELRQAAHLYRQVIARTENAPMDAKQALLRKGRALLGLGVLALERNDLAEADRFVTAGVAISQQFPDEELVAPGPAILARLKQAQGQVDQAQEILGSLAARTNYPVLLREVRTAQAGLSLSKGDLVSVQRWAAGISLSPGDAMALYQEQESLVVARLLIAQRQEAEALQLLITCLANAQDQVRVRSEIAIKILMALAYTALDDLPQAKQALIQALELAQPEGYLRLFLDEGEALGALLRSILPDLKAQPLANFVRAIIYAKAQGTGLENAPPYGSEPSIDPLSEQELRVLRLLAGGLTNPEIARELVVSLNTVKTHVKSIYRKLDVSSRKEASQAARYLNLV